MARQTKIKFDREADEAYKKSLPPQFGADIAGGVVREGTFRKRRDIQIASRKRREKIAAMRAAY